MTRVRKTFDDFVVDNNENKISNKKNKRGLKAAICAIVMASIVGVGTFFGIRALKNKNKGSNNIPTAPGITTNIDPEDINNLGIELEFPTNPTGKDKVIEGNIDLNKVVEGSDGDLYVSEEAANNSSKVGSSYVDDNDGSLTVNEDQTAAYEKEDGYEVQDESGNVIDTGNGDVPSGYSWDENRGEYVPTDEVGLYTYYDINGDGVPDLISWGTYYNFINTPDEEVVEEEYTENFDTTETQSTQEGQVNEDGSYTIYGYTYDSYEDYVQAKMYPEQYGIVGNRVISNIKIEDMNKSYVK